MLKFPFQNISKNGGLTLVEVLVALVILSVGLLGLAGLQINSLRGSSGSNNRVTATFIANDMAERLYANFKEASNDSYTNAGIMLTANNCGAPPTNCASNGITCSTQELETFDNFRMCQTITNDLPPGSTMRIACSTSPCVGGSLLTITVNWSEVRDNTLGARNESVILNLITPYQI
ncbi:MAG: type IV pilus modification protein PilV [Gammaproteobacteria bacterium]|nr:type IV pilus modification protein PilV [Gammaproteobacteria bacterium]